MTYISVLIQHHAGPTGDVLVCRQGDGPWEFPNGRAYTNETEEAAAARIAVESLGMVIRVGKRTLIGHKYPDDGFTEHIMCGNITHNTRTKADYHCYYEAVDIWQTEPVPGKYTEFRWVHPSELGQLAYAGDDRQFMAKYDPWINGRFIPDVRML